MHLYFTRCFSSWSIGTFCLHLSQGLGAWFSLWCSSISLMGTGSSHTEHSWMWRIQWFSWRSKVPTLMVRLLQGGRQGDDKTIGMFCMHVYIFHHSSLVPRPFEGWGVRKGLGTRLPSLIIIILCFLLRPLTHQLLQSFVSCSICLFWYKHYFSYPKYELFM